jgi:hypothetical protein
VIHISNGIVNIQGNEYKTVARRVMEAHEGKALKSVETEVLSHDPIVIKAAVVIQKGGDTMTFTGISAVLPDQARKIEKENPYEVAETSAVGRALGFAGYGEVSSIASADEMVKAGATAQGKPAAQVRAEGRLEERMAEIAGAAVDAGEPLPQEVLDSSERGMKEAMDEADLEAQTCSVHDAPMQRGVSKTKFDDLGNPKAYWYHDGPKGRCFGSGYRD